MLKVSDEHNEFPIPFEERSRGFQWFFSFFLVFLVESGKAHTSVDGSNPAISGHRKAGHFRRPETAREFYFMGSRTRKDLSLVKPGPPGP